MTEPLGLRILRRRGRTLTDTLQYIYHHLWSREGDFMLDLLVCGCNNPLRHAIQHQKAPIDVVRRLFDDQAHLVWDGALSWFDSSTCPDVACLVAERTPPAALLVPDPVDGNLPLCAMIRKGAPDAAIQMVAARSPTRAFTTANRLGQLPIHLVVSSFDCPCTHQTMKQVILRSPRKALMSRDCDGKLPIHACFSKDAPPIVSPEVVELLLQSSPAQVLLQRDEQGRLPIHCAIHSRASVQILQLLIHSSPPQVMLQGDEQGRLPIQCAIHNRSPVEAVDLLIHKSPPQALLRRDAKYMRLALHEVALGYADQHHYFRDLTWRDRVLALLARHSPAKAFAMADYSGKVPLHCALRAGVAPSMDSFELLVERTPRQVVLAPDSDGRHLLHYKYYPTHFRMLSLLIECFPELLLMPDTQSGKLPIHFAVQGRWASLEIIRVFVDRCPESLLVPDRFGLLPVHSLAQKQTTWARFLVNRSGPEALLMADAKGFLPLHRAIIDGVSGEIVQEMIDLCPQALVHFDDAGHLPLYHALVGKYFLNARVGESLLIGLPPDGGPIVPYMIERAPPSLMTMADPRSGGRVPLHHALELAVPPPIVQAMIERNPDAAQIPDNQGRLPLHNAVALGRSWSVVVQRLLDAFPGAILCKDKRGRCPLYIASQVENASLSVLYALVRLAPLKAVESLRDFDLQVSIQADDDPWKNLSDMV